MKEKSRVRVAVVQITPCLFETKKTLKKIALLTKEAAGKRAKLVLFPESTMPCYPRGLSFGTVIGSRSDKGRELWLKYSNESIVINSTNSEINELSRIARKSHVYLIVGLTEKDEITGTLYCSLVYFDPLGELIGVHRKVKPTAQERVIWGEGHALPTVYKTDFGRIGGLICWENYMPELRMHLYKQSPDIYVAPTADQRETWQNTLIHIACEGRCYVLGANQYVSKKDYPSGLPLYGELKNQDEIMCKGGSVIISPMGKILAGPCYGKEDILYADIDSDEIQKARFDMNVAGHYQRPDLFQ